MNDARAPGGDGGPVVRYRLHSRSISVELRMMEVDGRWIASADAPDGPSLGCGIRPFEALWAALEPFDGVLDELLASMPEFD